MTSRARLGRRVSTVVRLAVLASALCGCVRSALAAGEGSEHAASAEAQTGVRAGGLEGDGEHGAGGGEYAPAINGNTLALQLLNFGVLVAILIKFGGGAINKALTARHEQLKAELASAAAVRSQAEAHLRKHEERLAGLEREIAAMRAGFNQEAEVEKARLIAAAEERARRIREETAFVIEQQVKEAQVLLRRDVAESAMRIAEEILRRAIDANDQRRLLERFVTDVSDSTDDVVDKAV